MKPMIPIKLAETQEIIKIIAAIGGFGLFLIKYWNKIILPLRKWVYWHTTGYRVMLSIESSFGNEAGKKIKDMFYDLHNRLDIGNVRLDLLENTVNLGIYICDSDGKCIYANNTLSKIFGLDKSEMLGFGWLKPVTNKEEVFKEWEFSVKNKIPYKTEYELLNDNTIVTEAYPSIKEDIVVSWVGIAKEKSKTV